MAFYYPKNKIRENQYTAGKEYAYPTGVEYVGYYYTLSNGDVFSGKTPQDPFSKKLIPYIEYVVQQNEDINVFRYNFLKRNTTIPDIQKFKPIPLYYPVLTKKDYEIGIITRYFCKKINSDHKTIKEINQEIFESLFNKEKIYDSILNIVTKVPWQISGPLYNMYQGNVLMQPGIVDTNNNQIQLAEKNLPGISMYLTNPAEFARPKK